MMSNRSLIILDEIGRGTGTIDGISLAYSILKYLIESEFKPLVLFITHYPSIHVLEQEYPNQLVVNYHMGYQEIKIIHQERFRNHFYIIYVVVWLIICMD